MFVRALSCDVQILWSGSVRIVDASYCEFRGVLIGIGPWADGGPDACCASDLENKGLGMVGIGLVSRKGQLSGNCVAGSHGLQAKQEVGLCSVNRSLYIIVIGIDGRLWGIGSRIDIGPAAGHPNDGEAGKEDKFILHRLSLADWG